MRLSTILLCTAAVVALTGCAGEGKSLRYGVGEMDHSSLYPVELHGRVLAEGDYLGQPSRILRIGDNLLVLDGAADSVLHLISAQDGRRVRSQGGRGAGPGEYEGAKAIARDLHDPESAWAYDIALSRFTRVSTVGDERRNRDPEIINIEAELIPTQPLWVSDSIFVSPNFSPRGRLLFFDRQGRLLKVAGGLPADGQGTPPGVLQQAWVGRMAARPDGRRFVIVTQYADQVEFYGADGTELGKVRGPFRFDPLFTVEDIQGFKTMGSNESMRHGYVDVTATQYRIYALFSGRTREAFGQSASFGRYVHVFDWSGKLQQVLELDRDLISITLSADERLLYGSAHDPEPVIMSYELER